MKSLQSTPSFTEADGFKVAAAITGWDGDPNPIEDPTIGTLKFQLYQWDTQNRGYEELSEWIDTEPCREEEFKWIKGSQEHYNDNSNHTSFYPLAKSSIYDFDTYHDKFKCMKNDDI